MAISNFFRFCFFFPLTGFFKYSTHFQSAKQNKKLICKLKKQKKVQFILQTSGESIKDDMALLAWCGSENRNVWSEGNKDGVDFCSLTRPDLRFSLAVSECHDAIAYDGPCRLLLSSTFKVKIKYKPRKSNTLHDISEWLLLAIVLGSTLYYY